MNWVEKVVTVLSLFVWKYSHADFYKGEFLELIEEKKSLRIVL